MRLCGVRLRVIGGRWGRARSVGVGGLRVGLRAVLVCFGLDVLPKSLPVATNRAGVVLAFEAFLSIGVDEERRTVWTLAVTWAVRGDVLDNIARCGAGAEVNLIISSPLEHPPFALLLVIRRGAVELRRGEEGAGWFGWRPSAMGSRG